MPRVLKRQVHLPLGFFFPGNVRVDSYMAGNFLIFHFFLFIPFFFFFGLFRLEMLIMSTGNLDFTTLQAFKKNPQVYRCVPSTPTLK